MALSILGAILYQFCSFRVQGWGDSPIGLVRRKELTTLALNAFGQRELTPTWATCSKRLSLVGDVEAQMGHPHRWFTMQMSACMQVRSSRLWLRVGAPLVFPAKWGHRAPRREQEEKSLCPTHCARACVSFLTAKEKTPPSSFPPFIRPISQ